MNVFDVDETRQSFKMDTGVILLIQKYKYPEVLTLLKENLTPFINS